MTRAYVGVAGEEEDELDEPTESDAEVGTSEAEVVTTVVVGTAEGSTRATSVQSGSFSHHNQGMSVQN